VKKISRGFSSRLRTKIRYRAELRIDTRMVGDVVNHTQHSCKTPHP
jgi:hypothetical protein